MRLVLTRTGTALHVADDTVARLTVCGNAYDPEDAPRAYDHVPPFCSKCWSGAGFRRAPVDLAVGRPG